MFTYGWNGDESVYEKMKSQFDCNCCVFYAKTRKTNADEMKKWKTHKIQNTTKNEEEKMKKSGLVLDTTEPYAS